MQRRSTSQDVSWFLDLRRHNQLEMDPPYQRKSVWNAKDRRFFLDTIFRGYPCPPIFLHKTLDEDQKTVYAVVDGKQRLQTLFMFVDGGLTLPEDFGDARFNNKTWEQLETTERQILWDYVVPVEFLTFDAADTKTVSQAFDRLNRNMRKLEAQELRHARWDGWFITLVEKEADDAVWKELGVVTSARAKRMKDAQFISELLLVLIDRKMTGFDQQELDEAYSRLDDPDDSEWTIDTDQVITDLGLAKAYLKSMQDANGCIKQYASALAVFYTLWSAVVLHPDKLPKQPAELAATFAMFRERVDELSQAEDKAKLLKGDNAANYKFPNDFLEAYRGASTDLSQRSKRLEALLKFLEG